MLRIKASLGVCVFLFVGLTALVESQEDPRQAHGKFTGEIKPVFYVTDVEEVVPFYRDVLGFAFEGFSNLEGQPYYAEMAAAAVKFGLHEPTTNEQVTKVGQQRSYFRVEDLAAHRARVLAWGGDPGDIKQTGWMDMFIVEDPDGNEIVFAVTDSERHSSDPWHTSAPPGVN
jgi:predicted enzyme related to lactoylglutathione lyase